MTMPLTRLKKLHEKVIDEYINKFCNRQGWTFDDWDEEEYIVARFTNRMRVGIVDIIYDINTGQPKGRIMEWIDVHVTDRFTTYQDYCNSLAKP